MRTYSQLNPAEKAICDAVTVTWWFPSDRLPDTDMVSIFLRAHNSIRALDHHQGAVGISTAAMIEAIVSRYNYLVWLSHE